MFLILLLKDFLLLLVQGIENILRFLFADIAGLVLRLLIFLLLILLLLVGLLLILVLIVFIVLLIVILLVLVVLFVFIVFLTASAALLFLQHGLSIGQIVPGLIV